MRDTPAPTAAAPDGEAVPVTLLYRADLEFRRDGGFAKEFGRDLGIRQTGHTDVQIAAQQAEVVGRSVHQDPAPRILQHPQVRREVHRQWVQDECAGRGGDLHEAQSVGIAVVPGRLAVHGDAAGCTCGALRFPRPLGRVHIECGSLQGVRASVPG